MTDSLQLPSVVAGKNKSRRGSVVLVLIAICAVAAFAHWRYTGLVVTSRQAQVEGQAHAVQAPTPGLVTHVPVNEGQEVVQGQLLAVLDEVPLRAALAEAKASLRTAQAGGVPADIAGPANQEAQENAAAAVAQSRIAEDNARKLLEHWAAEHARTMVALRQPGGSAQPGWNALVAEEMQMRGNMESARQRVEDASRQRANADSALRRLQVADSLARPGPELIALWAARVAQAERDLAGAAMTAPEPGRVLWLAVRQGQRVNRGDTLMTFLPAASDSGGLWVTAVFDRRHMMRLRVGQACRIKLEDGPAMDGIIAALIPDQQTGYAKITFTRTDASARTYPGQNATVTVRVE